MRNALLWLLRLYAYLFHLAIGLFLLGIWVAAQSSGGNSLKLGMLPWEGAALTRAILILGCLGILFVVLAMMGWLRWLFPVWAVYVFGILLRGFFVSSYAFADAGQFKFGVWLTAGALLAFLGSLSLWWRQAKRPR